MKRHRHSVRSNDRALVQRFDLQKHSHQRNSHGKSALDAYEAREGPRAGTNHDPRDSQDSRIPGVIPPDEYVQNWLATTLRETNGQSAIGLDPDLQNSNSRPFNVRSLQRRPEFRPFLLESRYTSKQPDTSRRFGKHGSRTIESSSGSSFLELGLVPDTHDGSHEESAVVSKIEGSESRTGHNEDRIVGYATGSVQSNDSHSLILQETETYERRKRHKTRETRYESIKAPKASRASKRKKRKLEKSTSHRKDVRTGDHLMKKFSSRSVGQDRLTMRPLRTVGIFRNGRASSPVQNNGLPDLAFSEMEFLRRSKRQMNEKDENSILSKSREKERRRVARAQNEISAYFNPSTKEATEVDINANENTSKHVYNSVGRRIPNLGRKQIVDGYHGASCSLSTSQFADHEGPFLGFRRRGLTSETSTSTQVKARQSRTIEPADKGTTYYTWSESLRSPNVGRRTRERSSGISITPKSIRKSLDETGIFDNTGIGRGLQRGFDGVYKHSNNFEVQISLDRTSAGQGNVATPCGQSTAAFRTNELDPLPKRMHGLAKTLECKDTTIGANLQKPDGTPTECRDGNEASPRQCETIIKHFDTMSERHRETGQDAKRRDSRCSQPADRRRAIAKAAYLHHHKAAVTTKARTRMNIALPSVVEPHPDIPTNQPESRKPLEKTQTDADQNLTLVKDTSENPSKKKPGHDAEREQQREEAPIDITHEACSGNAFPSNTSPQTGNDAAIQVNKKAHFHVSTEANGDPIEGRSMDMNNPRISDTRDAAILNPKLAMAHKWEGLPVRGSSSGRINGLTCQTHLRSSALMVEPLYGRQLEAQRLHDSADLEHTSLHLSDHAYEAFDYGLIEDLSIPGDNGSAMFDDYRFGIDDGQTAGADYIENDGHTYVHAGEPEEPIDVRETEAYQPSMYGPFYQPENAHQVTRFTDAFGTARNIFDRPQSHMTYSNEHVGSYQYRHLSPSNVVLGYLKDDTQMNHFQATLSDALQHGEEYRLAGFWRPHTRY